MIIMVSVLGIKSIADIEGQKSMVLKTVLITSVALYFKKKCKVFSVMSTNPASNTARVDILAKIMYLL